MTVGTSKAAAGFTLAELLISLSLALAVMTAVLSSYIFLGRNLVRLVNQQTLETEARRTLAYFTRDVRMASGVTGTPSNTSVTFLLPTNFGTTTAAYSYDSSTQTLTRTLGGSTQTLLSNLIDLNFYYYDNLSASVTNPASIKQVAMRFSTQTGSSFNGTQTPVYQGASSRLIIRNKQLPP